MTQVGRYLLIGVRGSLTTTWTAPEPVIRSSDLPSNDWSFPMTPSIGSAACWASVTPKTTAHARRTKLRRCIKPRAADLCAGSPESAPYLCVIFIYSPLIDLVSLLPRYRQIVVYFGSSVPACSAAIYACVEFTPAN